MNSGTKKTAQKRYGLYLFLFVLWFVVYAFCESFSFLAKIASIDLIRAVLNLLMALVILTSAFIERFKLMSESEDYDAFVSSNKLFISLGMALVPFAAAISDLSRTSYGVKATTLFCVLLIIFCISEYIVFMKNTNKSMKLGFEVVCNWNFAAVVISLILFIITRDPVMLRLIDLLRDKGFLF